MRSFALFLTFVLGFAVGSLAIVSHPALAGFEDTSNWTKAPISVTVSSGTTPVSLVAGVTGRPIVPVHLSIVNHDNAERTVFILSNTTTIEPIILPALASYSFDNANGYRKTEKGEALQFKLDAGTTGVSVSGFALK